MRRLLALLPLALLLLALDASPAHSRGGAAARKPAQPRADRPSNALFRFKRAFARNDRQGEWDSLSPGFKRRISRMAGRTVDVGDYSTMRDQHAKDPRMRELRQWLPSASLSRVKYRGDGYADVVIRFGAPIIFGQDMRARMVNHNLWELRIKGEPQPYWGFADDKSIRVFRTRTGNNYVVEMRDPKGKVTWRKQWKPEQIQGYREMNRWYFDGFGKLEDEFMSKLR